MPVVNHSNISSHGILGILLLLATLAGPVSAQHTHQQNTQNRYTFISKGQPVEYALQKLVKTTGIDLIYDPSIITDHSVFVKAQKKQPEEILRRILKNSRLDFIQLSSGTYVLTISTQRQALTGNLTGRVTDRQTGKPLDGANVMLADASGGAATTGTGHFTIPKLTQGYHKITINYVGYKPIRDTVWVPANAATSLNFSMTSQPVAIDPIVVEGLRKRMPSSRALSSGLSSSQIVSKRSNSTIDAVKSLEAIAGISFSLALADFSIQGGSNGNHELRLDGVPIYNPVSMGRMLGAFSPWAIQKIKVSKAGYGAQVGSQLSGVIDMVQNVGDSKNQHFLLQANPMDINSRFNQQFSIENGPSVKLMLAGRSNIWNWYQEPTFQQTFRNWDRLDPLLTLNLLSNGSSDTIFQTRDHSYNIRYYDLHAAVQIDHNPFHKTTVSAYHGKNTLETDLFSENTVILSQSANLFYSTDQYNWTNTMAKIKHDWVVSPRLDATASGYITRHSFNHQYLFTNDREAQLAMPAFSDPQRALEDYAMNTIKTGDKNAMIQSSVQMGLTYRVTKNYTLSGRLRTTHLDYRFNLSDQYYNATQSNARSFLLTGYLQNDFLLTQKTSLSAGNRFTFVPSRDLVFAEPRISLKHDLPNTSIGYLSGKISGGIYRQFINQFDVSNVAPSSLVPSIRFWVPIDYTTTVPKAYHLAFNGLWEPTKSWKIQLESYYKWIPSQLMLDYKKLSRFPYPGQPAVFSKQAQFIASSRGYAYGAGLSFNKHIPSAHISLEGSYQYNIARQLFPSRFGNSYQPLPSSQPHILDLSVNWNVNPQIALLLQWKGIWGRSWGFRKAYYDYLSIKENRTAYGSFSFNDPGRNKLPLYSELNAGFSYKLDIESAGLRFRLDVFNLLNRKNVLNWWLSPYQNESGTLSYRLKKRSMSGFRPSLSIKLSY